MCSKRIYLRLLIFFATFFFGSIIAMFVGLPKVLNKVEKTKTFCEVKQRTASIGLSEEKAVSGEVLNGKAKFLAQPLYPPAAKAVGASGQVSVQVSIDEDGNVISANAVSGHPLLKTAATDAAIQSKFSRTFLSGEPVKVSGTIIYNFASSNNRD